ncbi:MAG: hypothetical protein LBV71_11475 [Prevotella sp.]|jgi:hypothetical protein|nr:hypothetical protein [Prevotella sp.]
MNDILIAEVEEKSSEVSIEDFIPKAFGYNLELDGSVSLTKLVDLMGRGGINYTVFTVGEFAWYPFLYLHLGYSIDTIITRGIKDTIKSLIDPKKAASFFKLSGSISVNASPFLAFRKCSDIRVTPSSWEEWFMASSISVKLKAGLGISFGGTYFAGADDGKPTLAVLSVDEAYDRGKWWGASLDIGAGLGSPSLDFTLSYASYYWLMDEEKESKNRDYLDFAIRWIHFIKLRTDIVSIFENISGVEMPEWLRKIIRTATIIVQRENIETLDDYYNLANKEDIDVEYKQMLANQGLTPQFFAALNNGESEDEYFA